MIAAAILHRTVYRYDRAVTLTPQVIRLRPAPHCRTTVTAYSLRLEPAEHFLTWQQDPLGNWDARAVFPAPTRELAITVELHVEVVPRNPFDFFLDASAERFPFAYDAGLAPALAPYRHAEAPGPLLRGLLAAVDRQPGSTIDACVALNRLVHERVRYLIRLEPGVQSPEKTLHLGSGSCRDSAWLLVQLARHLGLAARFASGYLAQLAPDAVAGEPPPALTNDLVDLHAWAEVFLPGAGWIGLDPTSGLLCGEGHLPLACTPEPASAAPLSGSFAFTPQHEGDEVTNEFAVTMQVQRLASSPRTTAPYREDQWAAMRALGERIDAALQAGDVRLTVGGEPTFVAMADAERPEWTTQALGEDKLRRAIALWRRLRERLCPGGIAHYGQGKWYPGEPLPRFALNLWWREDGVPVWRDAALIADPRKPAGHGEAEARRLLVALAAALGVGLDYAMPAYEDAWYYLWREHRLPVNVDVKDAKLDDALERARLARVFDQGLHAAVAHVLPLCRASTAGGAIGAADEVGSSWRSGPWFLRRTRLVLVPGDSPAGWRLPLDGLPFATPEDLAAEASPQRDPMQRLPPLPSRQPIQLRSALAAAGAHPPPGPMAQPAPQLGSSATGLVRTALCIEPRGGVLHVFLPPLATAEDWLALVAAVERAAAETCLQVQLEGYPSPRDARLRHLSVTPDPGVIEVNIPPARSFAEATMLTQALYADARAEGLSAERFHLDGRHAGTGGGNHVTLGGPQPADSPFLRRPDLLRSLLTVFHNHPALSYAFSGMFIGPTSQAPRPDEARGETATELALALAQLPGPQQTCPPWQVDRVLRHVLTDVTGNTHRTQLCIDKLYAPEHVTGRLGLVEIRCLEMPPHPEMSLVQQLLIRALIARAWRSPIHDALARWDGQLHDRFLLPQQLAADLHEVLADLADHGYVFDPAWFEPHLEFRCPLLGRFAHDGIQVELRSALEPWHVLGEEATTSGTARYVDSSLERIQVHVTGMTEGRHTVACNGIALPLHPTGVAGAFVCGVRFRAWQPPSCLHPNIGVHAPLVFDLHDTWLGRAVAGGVYHVAHPGGRAYDRYPVNAGEAAARRAARFQAFGHTPGRAIPRDPPRDVRAPMTLDLRRA